MLAEELLVAVVIPPLHIGHKEIPLEGYYTVRNGGRNPQFSLCAKIHSYVQLKIELANQVGIFQSYAYFTTKFPFCVKGIHLGSMFGRFANGTTNILFDCQYENIHLIWLTQTANASC